jgi:hypothetical protein
LKLALLASVFAPVWRDLAVAQLQFLSDAQPQQVFAGDARLITVHLRNIGAQTLDADLRTRLSQASSATVVQLAEAPWKKLQVAAGQTIVDSAMFNFPAVKAETRFLVQWLENTNRVLGTTHVLVYPTAMLSELKPLAGGKALGVFDLQNQIQPLLKNVAVEFADLEDAGLDNFHGKLAIIGPFESKTQVRESLGKQIEALAAKGVAVVWIQPPPGRRDPLQPSFYTLAVGRAAVVVVQAGMVSNLRDNPQSQLNLIHFSRLALHPEPVRLPHLTPQPLNQSEL